jgi:hypothetical protein
LIRRSSLKNSDRDGPVASLATSALKRQIALWKLFDVEVLAP